MTGQLLAFLAVAAAAVIPGVLMLRARRPKRTGRHRGDLAARLPSRRRLLVLERELGWTEQ